MRPRNLHIEKIIDGCLKNDRQAQHELYNYYSPSMLGICQRYTKTTEEAEDCMIDGFMHVFEHLQEFRNECSLGTWIRTIMVNVSLDHYRKNKYCKLEDDMDTILENVANSKGSSDQEVITTKLEAKMIMEQMKEMPDSYRIIFNMHTIDDYTFKDIAEALDMKDSTVRVYYQRARTWLIEKLGNNEEV